MKTKQPSIWMATLVQHSGYGYGGNPQFIKAVEPRFLHSQKDIDRVIKAGGIVFEPGDAEDKAYDVNYPEAKNETKFVENGIIPRTKGKFSNKKIDGLKIYIVA